MKLNEADQYFSWLCAKVPSDFGAKTYNKLLKALFETEFVYILDMDAYRAVHGTYLRKEYAEENCLEETWRASEPCSVLEMMVALARIIENQIMKDDDKGNRTGRWFWDMVISMGLISMDDSNYRDEVVKNKINIMLTRKYAANGKGGLFTIPNTKFDLRTIDIWYQAMWYLSECMGQKPLQLK